MNVDPLRPADTDIEHRWWISEVEMYREADRRARQRRREARWAMLLCFTLLLCIVIAAIVLHGRNGS